MARGGGGASPLAPQDCHPPCHGAMSITTMADPAVCVPDFLAAELESGDDLIHTRDRLQQKNWLTDEL
jgi:hypothetical protein